MASRQRVLAVLLLGLSLLPLSGCNDPGGPRAPLRTRWLREQSSGSEHIRPASDGVRVYAATEDGEIVARDAVDGAERWRVRIASGAPGGEAMVLSAGTLVVPIEFSTSAIDVATGRELWRYVPPLDTVDAGSSAGPGLVSDIRIAADANTVYQPAWGASVSAIDLRSGQARWIWQPALTLTDTAASGVFRSGAEGVAL